MLPTKPCLCRNKILIALSSATRNSQPLVESFEENRIVLQTSANRLPIFGSIRLLDNDK